MRRLTTGLCELILGVALLFYIWTLFIEINYRAPAQRQFNNASFDFTIALGRGDLRRMDQDMLLMKDALMKLNKSLDMQVLNFHSER